MLESDIFVKLINKLTCVQSSQEIFFFCITCMFVTSHDESSPVGMRGRGAALLRLVNHKRARVSHSSVNCSDILSSSWPTCFMTHIHNTFPKQQSYNTCACMKLCRRRSHGRSGSLCIKKKLKWGFFFNHLQGHITAFTIICFNHHLL